MPYLVAVSLLWAFSYGLIKGRLAGLDSAFVSAARLGLALLVFLPFLRFRGLTAGRIAALLGIGALQFGCMYLAYNESFRLLRAYEVALFTITTPFFVTLFADALERKFHPRALLAATLTVIGTALVAVKSEEIKLTLTGFALVQLSNVAFAIGQVLYARLRRSHTSLRDREVFGWLYLGAFAVTALAMAWRSPTISLTSGHVITLVYLGVLASGVGFFLWNIGATKVDAGTLAVMNNAKVPLAVACSLLFFGESADLRWLLASLGLIAVALWVARPKAG